jgi:hypothetical protein
MSKSADGVEPKTKVGWLWRQSTASRRRKRRTVRAIESAFVAATAVLACLVLAELGVRIAMPSPLLEWRDFRHNRPTTTINHRVQYDSLLGWRLKPFLTEDGFHTLDYGIRSNGRTNSKVEQGGVIAVGSSFTVGSGVTDSETWPAQLQQLTGWNVNNAGQGGYQADQIILIAEQLLPLIRPQVLVVDLIPDTIMFTGRASSGWAKPYFTIANGNLVAHNSPVPHGDGRHRGRFDIRSFLGHSAAVNTFMATFFANFWFTSEGNSFINISTDEIGVTCRLLERLKKESDAAGVTVLLYLQYSGAEVIHGSRIATGGKLYNLERRIKEKLIPFVLDFPPGAPTWHDASEGVSECALGLGITTVDELPLLRAVYETNPAALRKYYQVEGNGVFGHKSPFGNAEVARLVAAAIANLGVLSERQAKQANGAASRF